MQKTGFQPSSNEPDESAASTHMQGDLFIEKPDTGQAE